MGLVEERDGVANDPVFPPKIMVASFGPDVTPSAPPGAVAKSAAMPVVPLPAEQTARRPAGTSDSRCRLGIHGASRTGAVARASRTMSHTPLAFFVGERNETR
jgi:hypothetical protein